MWLNVLVGAVAMALQGEVRATQDIDLFVPPDAENVRRIRDALDSVLSEWSAFCRRLHPCRLPPGVSRYRTMDEAVAERESWERG